MKYLHILAVMTGLLTAPAVFGQPQESLPGKGLFQIDIDHAKFLGSDSTVFVELYYGIREHILTYLPDSNGYSGGVVMHLTIRKDTATVEDKAWSVPHQITDTASLAGGKTMVGLESVMLPPGIYLVTLVTRDIHNPSRSDSFSTMLAAAPFPVQSESFSDIELCTAIAPAEDTAGMFYKNTLNVIPNASMLYGPGLPFLYYYAEGYNLTNPDHVSDAILRTTITDGSGNDIYNQSKVKKRIHPSVVEQGRINISGYRGGTYHLRLTLTDSAGHLFATTAKKFFVFRPGMTDTLPSTPPLLSSVDFSTSEYASMPEEAVDKEFAMARYIATEPERKQWEKLDDVQGKRKFLYEFWRTRNANPGSGRNEARIDYMRRVNHATEQFSKGFREGWKTDRGRVHILYGPPDEIEQFPSTPESNPYEIWHFNAIQGGVIFVFVDRTGMGQYQLVHSTHRDELYDPNWYQQYAQRTN